MVGNFGELRTVHSIGVEDFIVNDGKDRVNVTAFEGG